MRSLVKCCLKLEFCVCFDGLVQCLSEFSVISCLPIKRILISGLMQFFLPCFLFLLLVCCGILPPTPACPVDVACW